MTTQNLNLPIELEEQDSYKNLLNDLEDAISNLRLYVYHYIDDKKIPVEKRWKVWCDAPSQIKRHQTWIMRFESLGEDAIMYDGEIHCERYQTLEVGDIFNQLLDSYMWDKYADTPMEVDNVEWSPRLKAFAEEVMEKRLGSFVYDW